MRTVSENIESDQPNLAQLNRMIPKHGDLMVQTILIHALNELKDLINVGKNLTNPQIYFIAQRIVAKYGYLKMEEVKYVLYRAVEREKLYDRLDPNIVLGWFSAYDDERTEEAMRLSDQEALQRENQIATVPNAVTFEQYVEGLQEKADNGDSDAQDRLNEIAANTKRMDGRRLSDKGFKQYFYNQYLKRKK